MCRRLEDFDLHKELYRGKSSLLYMATDKQSGQQVALKLYRKRKLSTLNRCEGRGEGMHATAGGEESRMRTLQMSDENPSTCSSLSCTFIIPLP